MSTWQSVGQRHRARLKRAVEAGADCAHCGQPIEAGQPWDVHHLSRQADDADGIDDPDNLAPSHRSCNRADNRPAGRPRRPPPAQQPAPITLPAAPAQTSITTHPDGWIMPRICTSDPNRPSPLGDEAVAWIDQHCPGPGGEPLMPHQAWTIRQILQTDDDGTLLHPVVLLVLSRQQGKSHMVGRLAWWRIHQRDRWGQAQTVLTTAGANLSLMCDSLRSVAAAAGDPASPRDADLTHRVDGGEWIVRACTARGVTGRSLTTAWVDEVQLVRSDDIIRRGLEPTMSGSRIVAPQLITSGTGELPSSVSMRRLRAHPQTLTIAWTPPPGADPAAEDTWRWASPDWSESRRRWMSREADSGDLAVFSTEYLCLAARPDEQSRLIRSASLTHMPAPSAQQQAAAAAVDSHGTSHVAAWAHQTAGGWHITTSVYPTLAAAADAARATHPPVLYAGAGISSLPQLVDGREPPPTRAGLSETRAGLPHLRAALASGRMSVTAGDPIIDALAATTIHTRQDGTLAVGTTGPQTLPIATAAWLARHLDTQQDTPMIV